MNNIILKIEQLSKSYGEIEALNNVNLCLRAGEVYGLIGESGCGKSTLAKCIMNLEVWDQGQIVLCDHVLKKRPARSERKRLSRYRAMIFQDTKASFDATSSVEFALQEPFMIQKEKISKKSLVDLMKRCELNESLMKRKCSTLSQGQLARLAIARAIALLPDLLIADESIASLDVSLQAQMINLFKDLQEKDGFAFLMIGHDLDLIRFTADRIGVMKDGKIIEEGSVDEVFEHPVQEYTKALLASRFHAEEGKKDAKDH